MLIYDYTHLTLPWFEWSLRRHWNHKGKLKGHGCCYGNHVEFCGTSYFWLRHFDGPSLSMIIQESFVKRFVREEKIKARENNHELLFLKKKQNKTLFSLHVPPLFLDFNEVYIFSDSHKNYVIKREMPLLLLDDFPSEHIRGSGYLQWSLVIVLSCLVSKSYRREQTVKTVPAMFLVSTLSICLSKLWYYPDDCSLLIILLTLCSNCVNVLS